MKGRLILVVGQTGSGKGTLLNHVRGVLPDLVFPVSCTTRAMRPGEVAGKNYYFISDEEFKERIARDEFLEWVHTDGKRYGTLKSEILEALERGKSVVREMDVKGVVKVRQFLPPEMIRTIYINAGSWDELRVRILARAPLSGEELESRRRRFEEELHFEHEADFIVQNPTGGLLQAQIDFVRAVEEAQR